MSVAIEAGNHTAIFSGIIAMIILIFVIDTVFCRPLLSWTQRYRLDEFSSEANVEPIMQLALRESRLIQIFRKYFGKSFRRFWGRVRKVGELL
jgi:ABC-type anion transport system duplicated permease subunit